MSDTAFPSLKEVWEWKRQTEEETKGMSREQLIDFYRRKGREALQRFGIDLPTRPAGQRDESAGRTRQAG
jgi:hypothetical protein